MLTRKMRTKNQHTKTYGKKRRKHSEGNLQLQMPIHQKRFQANNNLSLHSQKLSKEEATKPKASRKEGSNRD